MEKFICPVVLLVIGGVLFMQWRKAKSAENRRAAMLWMVASVIVIVFGLTNLLAAIIP